MATIPKFLEARFTVKFDGSVLYGLSFEEKTVLEQISAKQPKPWIVEVLPS